MTRMRLLARPDFPVTPAPSGVFQRSCACGAKAAGRGKCAKCDAKDTKGSPLQRETVRAEQTEEVPPIVHDVQPSTRQPVVRSTRVMKDTHVGHDFSQVSVQLDTTAAESNTDSGQRLLARESIDIVGQQSQTVVQRQVTPNLGGSQVPIELRNSVDVRKLSPLELQSRHDLIVQTMKNFNASTPDYRLLEVEFDRVVNELARREALKAGRTFGDAEVAKMKEYFIANATSAAPKGCITCMNEAIRLVLGDQKQKVGSEVEKTMAKLQQSGHAGAARMIEFEDRRGRITTGTLYPAKLHESVWDALFQMSGGDVGWSIFGMSVMHGNHSVTLTLDNSDPRTPHVYWSDQWSTKGGWLEYDRAGLDAELTRLTQGWWNKQPEGRKFNTRVTLWRLNQ